MIEMILLDLEKRINNNYFKSKNELINYIEFLRQNNNLDIELFNKKVKELLELYDSKTVSSELPLDMQNYTDAKLSSGNYIVSGEDDKVLKTNNNIGELSQEFKKVQNEIVADNKEGNINANTIFNHMEKYQKESSTLMPLSNLNMDIIDKEILDKIKFFIKNGNVNIFEYQVDISNGVFLNVNTNELFEVRKNPNTNAYEVYKGSQAQYNTETIKDNEGSDITVTDDIASLSDEELMAYQERTNITSAQRQMAIVELAKRKNKPKTRVLRMNPLTGNRAAFVKTSFIMIMGILSIITCILLLLLLK